MPIKGSLKEASLPDVVQLISLGQKTGCLSVTHRNNFGSIYFDKGRVCFASIVNRRDRLGDILVKSGKLTQAQLDEAIGLQSRNRDMRLGDILVKQGMLSRDALNDQIRVQIEEAVYFLFTWPQGTFNFEADVRPELQDFLVSISADSLLMEGARRVDEWSLIEKRIPTFDIIFDVDRTRLTSSGVALTAEQQTVARLIDSQRDLRQISEESGLVEFEVAKAVYGLLTAGFVRRVGTSKQSDAKVPEARVEEHRNLGIAYYKAGILDEAIREFRQVTELRPGDDAGRFYLGLSCLRLGKWLDAANEFREATQSREATGAVFHNHAYVLERLGKYDEARAALDEAARRGLGNDPRVRTSMAFVALSRGELTAANQLFREAGLLFAPRGPSAVWFHGAALTAALEADLERAKSTLEEGLAAYPNSPVLYNDLAVVQERLDQLDDACASAERGVQEESGLPQLHKNLGDAHFRAGRLDEALDAYQTATRLNPEIGPDVYVKTGTIYRKRNQMELAIRAWERALEIDPSHLAARDNLDAAREGVT